ncbi:hypothetical protein GCM10025771_16320 [Niveibacterium umoris]|uniref:Glutaredoxin n=1 Tax=Niveibacterium umoris TaxID=1193620 RepID=A0A840BSJ6_9RHOO|nr:glutaredoxin family protein [Niveibacterium umoris]MBB4014498.1 glutaredoxin [Niveibacterium umoris]
MNTKFTLIAIIATALAGAAPAAHAEAVFKWVDSSGRVHYSDMPPPPDAKKVEERMMRGIAPASSDKMSPAMRQAVERSPVKLYTTAENCDGCAPARQYLQGRGIPFTEVKLTNQDEAAAAAKVLGKAKPEEVGVPALLIGSKPINGYLESEWASELTSAGYPAKR